MNDVEDYKKLTALDDLQECSSCGIDDISPDNCEVFDGEVMCLDCFESYHSESAQWRNSAEYHEKLRAAGFFN